ncbi:MAG: hypothetical protein QM817_34615 [Archangium sp.]
MASRTWTLLLTVALFSLSGCESTDDVIAKHKPAVEAALKAISSLPRTAEPLTQNTLKAPSGALSDVLFVYEDDLAEVMEAPHDVPLRTIDSLPLLQCVSILRIGHLFKDSVTRLSPSLATAYLEACEHAKYVLVIRKRLYTRPELQLETKQFAPGKFDADVSLYAVSGEAFGGFKVSATNDARVSLLDGDQNHVQRLIGNLESTTFDALRAETKKLLPGAMP